MIISSFDTDKYLVNLSPQEVIKKLNTKISGLSQNEILVRQKIYGQNELHKKNNGLLKILFRQFTGNPLLIILIIASLISFYLGEKTSSEYILGMILLSILLGLFNEYSAEKTVENLLQKISLQATVLRSGEKMEVDVKNLTLGDIVFLSQGNIVPADLRLVETNSLEINESLLSGESLPVFKTHLPIDVKTEGNLTGNIAFMGTTVENGLGEGVVVNIGKETQFGQIAESISFIRPPTEFQKGLSKFSNLIIKVVLLLTIFIFTLNYFLGHSLIEALMFGLAIAVGLTPELLPVIVTVSLSHGAGKLARKHLVVKRLIGIENLGNMDILCTDKTGTLTEGKIQTVDFIDIQKGELTSLQELSLLCNSAISHHKIVGNPIDKALKEYGVSNNISLEKTFKKTFEEPFDYNRKMMFSIVEKDGHGYLIAKGAPDTIEKFVGNPSQRKSILSQITDLENEGLRVICIASKKIPLIKTYDWNDVNDLECNGLVTFRDVPKISAKEALLKFHKLHVGIKLITGDSVNITRRICTEVGMNTERIITGEEMDHFNENELMQNASSCDIFARMNPSQKLKIVQVLQKSGHTVGFLGDGINDLPSLHNADVGISVNTAVDVAKDAATIVLLQKSLNVIADGIIEGRKTFNNTIKYILMSTSSNFGNMFSASGASFFLPFLPMTPVQILLNNALYDLSQVTIPSDNVDHESLVKPRHWNIDFIKNYMLFFGPLSSLYDFLTFAILYFLFKAQSSLFQTGWFIESICTQILVVFIIRTSRTPFYRSRPGIWLTLVSLLVVMVSVILPFTPISSKLGFVPPPPHFFPTLILLVTTYLFLIEKVKTIFLKRYSL